MRLRRMPGAYGDIARVLGGARRRQVRLVLLGAGAAGLALALLCLLAGAVALGLGARTPFRVIALAGACLGLAASLSRGALALLRSARDDAGAVRAMAWGRSGLRSALLSAVELAGGREEIAASGRFSVALVDAHLDRTAASARAIDLRQAIPDRPARRAGLALAAVLGAHLAAFVVAGPPLGRAYARVLRGDPAGAPRAQVDPITGDVEITYRYPAYMRREPRTLSGTGGELRAPKGTEVLLRTRADRPVQRAELDVASELPGPAPGDEARAPGGSSAPGALTGRFALQVTGGRDLAGRLVVGDGGSYRFRFLDARGRTVAEGPPIPIVVEPDAYPEARILSPERELEVDGDRVVPIEWQAEDDFGVQEVTLVLKPPAGEEQRRPLRREGTLRHDGGTVDLPLAPLGLAEGERLSYWIEALDTDTVSGPKKGASEPHTIKIYSEAEHRRQALEQARQVFEELLALLGDRLETFARGPVATAERLPAAQALDARTRSLHETMREVARQIRRDPAGPREVAAALQNVAGNLRVAEQRLTAARVPIAQALRVRLRPDPGIVRAMAHLDGELDRQLENGVLYLEQLLDKRRAEDLLRLAKDLAGRRRELAGLLEKYRQAPSEEGKKELLARIERMKERVKDLLAKMAELSKGFNDEHMNAEALAELSRSQDLVSGLDEVERKLAQGDLEGAMKALDQMASAMDRMLAGLQRTAGLPDEKARALMKEMLAFKEELEKVEQEQQRTADQTEQVRAEYRRRIADRLKGAEKELERLAGLAQQARREVEQAQPGVTLRAELDYELSREGLKDLERALGMKELEGAAEAVGRAQPSVERLSMVLEEDAQLAQRTQSLTGKDPLQIAEAERSVRGAAPKVREIRDRLARLLPDPQSVLGKGEKERLGELARRQAELERKAAGLQGKLQELAQKAPVFPPQAGEELEGSRSHMGQAAAELGARNPQRGHGEQQLALDGLARFKKGLEDAARRQGEGGGEGFPFPFAESGGEQGGDGREPSREKVKIPGAEAHRVPEEFRKDLLEAMKQGAPERYRGEVQHYYEELVK